MNVKQWTRIFKALANENRIKIIKFLLREREMSVSEIAEEIDISIKWTSKNLIQLANVEILESMGKHGQVYYKINPLIRCEVSDIIKKL
ncbi:ArsR/SmtB family transcription factor [Patescibacteria group bacterium]